MDENGNAHSSSDPTANQIDEMRKQIVTELSVNDKYKKLRYKKWFKPKEGASSTDVKPIDENKYEFYDVYEIKDWKPNLFWGPTTKTVTATFKIDGKKLKLEKESVEVK